MNKGTKHWGRGRSDIMIGISTLVMWNRREEFSKADVGTVAGDALGPAKAMASMGSVWAASLHRW